MRAPDDRRKDTAARMRRLRARIKSGHAQYRVELDENRIIEALLAAGFLDEDACARKAAVTAALAVVLSQWVELWVDRKM